MVTIAIKNPMKSSYPFLSVCWRKKEESIPNIIEEFNSALDGFDVECSRESFCHALAHKLDAKVMLNPKWFMSVQTSKEGEFLGTHFEVDEYERLVSFVIDHDLPTTEGDDCDCFIAVSPTAIRFTMEYQELAIVSEPHVRRKDF